MAVDQTADLVGVIDLPHEDQHLRLGRVNPDRFDQNLWVRAPDRLWTGLRS
jgi:hypothetical protein